MAIGLSRIGLADVPLVLLHPRLKGRGVEPFLVRDLAVSVRSRLETILVIVLVAAIIVFGCCVVAPLAVVFILGLAGGRIVFNQQGCDISREGRL